MNDDLIALLREAQQFINGEVDYPLTITDRIDAAIADLSIPDARVTLSDVASLQRWSFGFGQDCGAEMEEDDEGEFILLADVLRLKEKA